MACLDDLVEATNALAVSLQGAIGCGCGAAGAPATSPAELETDTGDITEPTGTPPDGYADWAAYQAQKCDVASWIMSNFLADVQWLQANYVGLLILAGLVSLLSGGTVALIAAILAVILGYDVAILDDLEEAIQAGFEDLLCALVTGSDAASSISQFETELQTQINAQTSDPLARALLFQLGRYWADTTQVNLMYAPADEVALQAIPTGGDCAACGLACSQIYITEGEFIGGTSYAAIERSPGGDWSIQLVFNASGTNPNCSEFCGPEVDLSIGLTGWSDAGVATPNFRVWSDTACPVTGSNQDVYSSDTAPGPLTGVRRINVLSNTSFTMEVTL